MAQVDPKIAAIVAHLPETKAAVRRTRDRVADVAEGLFAAHDRPGRHQIARENGRVDALVSLGGPAPLSVEFGHWAGDGADRIYVEGLHVLGRAVARVEAEGR